MLKSLKWRMDVLFQIEMTDKYFHSPEE